MKLKFANALPLALIMAMLFTSVGLADTITSDADVIISGDQAARDLGTVAPGAILTPQVNFVLVCAGKNHVDNGQLISLTFNLAGSSVPAGSLSASTATIGHIPAEWPDDTTGGGSTNCPATPPTLGDNGNSTVTITAPSAPGSYTYVVKYSVAFSPSQSDDPSDITGPAPTATFTLTVPAPPSNTPPSVSVTGVTEGASYSKGSVPAAGCSVIDSEDGNSSFLATLSEITGPYASDGIGSQTASCSYTDAGGLNATASATYSIVDPSAPSINYTLNPASPDGNNGWYKANVTLTWNVSEPESPNSLTKTDCVDQNIAADQAETAYACSASSAGGSAGPVSVSIKRDATAPTISGSASPAANGSGWNNTDVTVSFTCSDGLSGVATCGSNQTLSSDGAGQSATGNASDNAGNSASATVGGINIDKTPPVVAVTGVTNGATYTLGSVPAAGCSTTDALSGVAMNATLSFSGGLVGSVTATCSGAEDFAGNFGSASVTYDVIYNWTGFFQPVDNNALNTAKAGSAIPVKFSLGGDQGLGIFATGYPKFVKTSCTTGLPEDAIETTVTAGGSSLTYDALAGQYIYVWKTEKSWVGWCGQLQVKLTDGTMHTASFKLK